MKISYTDRHCSIVAENPDDRLSQHCHEKLRDMILKEATEFFEEVKVAMRKLPEGESLEMESTPIRVSLTKDFDESKVTAEV